MKKVNAFCGEWQSIFLYGILVMDYDSLIERISLPFDLNKFPQNMEWEKQTVDKCV